MTHARIQFRRGSSLTITLLLLLLGEHPLSASGPGLQFTRIDRSLNTIELRWVPRGTNLDYRVEVRRSVDAGPWVPADSRLPWPQATGIYATSTTNVARFYRLAEMPRTRRGHLDHARFLRNLSTAEIQALFAARRIPITPQYSVALYKLRYETPNALGLPVVASGLLAIPRNSPGAAALASYQHGTVTLTNDVPSRENEEGSVGIALATTGYVAALPDFIGLGDSAGLHPYHHAASEATAIVDMLRAARTFVLTNGPTLSGRLFLLGYSQGGHATMAAARELERFHTNEFTLTASAPMAGAYDLSGVTATDILSGRAQPNPYYFLYLLGAYQSVYGMGASLAALLASPYDVNLPPLLDGAHGGSQINQAMPAAPIQILKPEILQALRDDPNHPLRQVLEDNDLYAWTPRAPMRMFHCLGDQDVPFGNSQVALTNFHNRGATHVELVDPNPSANHSDCAAISLFSAKFWFDELNR